MQIFHISFPILIFHLNRIIETLNNRRRMIREKLMASGAFNFDVQLGMLSGICVSLSFTPSLS